MPAYTAASVFFGGERGDFLAKRSGIVIYYNTVLIPVLTPIQTCRSGNGPECPAAEDMRKKTIILVPVPLISTSAAEDPEEAPP